VKENMQLIAKNSGLSIGLVITLASFMFFGGMALGSIRTTMETHEKLPVHAGQKDLYVPRTEVDLQFRLVRKELEKNRELMEEVLLEVKK